MNAQETLYAMALSRAPRINLINQRLLVNALGSATAVFEHRHHILDALPDASPALAEALAGLDTLLPRAEEEFEFAQKSHIQCLGINDDAYPSRLRECPDAPILLYYLGQANLNRLQVISVVGTRHITEYGKDLCRDFIRDLSQLCPDTLVVSGLAYGVDVHTHRAALDNGMHTAGVLAHGLDQIYPRMHKQTAAQQANTTYKGLLEARKEALWNNFEDKEQHVYDVDVGTHKVGVDIPAGNWCIRYFDTFPKTVTITHNFVRTRLRIYSPSMKGYTPDMLTHSYLKLAEGDTVKIEADKGNVGLFFIPLSNDYLE